MDNISSMEINRFAPVSTAGRLQFVRSLVDQHLDALIEAREAGEGLLPPAWAQAPAFKLHIYAGLAQIMDDAECRQCLRHIVICGEDARVVVFVHEPIDVVTEALTKWSGAMAASLVAGRSLRHAGQPVAS